MGGGRVRSKAELAIASLVVPPILNPQSRILNPAPAGSSLSRLSLRSAYGGKATGGDPAAEAVRQHRGGDVSQPRAHGGHAHSRARADAAAARADRAGGHPRARARGARRAG